MVLRDYFETVTHEPNRTTVSGGGVGVHTWRAKGNLPIPLVMSMKGLRFCEFLYWSYSVRLLLVFVSAFEPILKQ